MALETVVYQNPKDPLISYGCSKDFYSLGGSGVGVGGGGGGGSWDYDNCLQEEDKALLLGILDDDNDIDHHQSGHLHANYYWDSSSSPPSALQTMKDHHQCDIPNSTSSPEACCSVDQPLPPAFQLPPMETPPLPTNTAAAAAAASCRRKRRRTRTSKNKEEIENQRMTHIVVERNRRKQMNEYLAILRSLMPSSYVQRGDQASIIGGAINFVKELEQFLQSMEGNKNKTTKQQDKSFATTSSPLAEFFTFPQYSTRATQGGNSAGVVGAQEEQETTNIAANQNQRWAAVADIEVTMVDSHANLKILSKKRPRQLLKMVTGLQALRLTILHLNLTTVDHMVLYTVSVKIEEGCQLTTVDEIAAAVNQMLRKIQEEAAFS